MATDEMAAKNQFLDHCDIIFVDGDGLSEPMIKTVRDPPLSVITWRLLT